MRPNFLPFPLRHILLLILLLGSAFQGVSQNPETNRANHWFFGFGSGLDFSNGAPVAELGGLQKGPEACVSMSDTNGNLLFYGSHDTLYTRNHQFMSNGDLTNGVNPSQMVAVPQPGNDSLYYVFYSTTFGNGLNKDAKYAIVNMNRNGGVGEVIEKDQVFLDGSQFNNAATEKVAAVNHCNGNDVWIHAKYINSDSLKVWKLTSNGLDTSTPLVTPGIAIPENGSGHFKFSPNGQYGASALVNPSITSCQDSIGLYQFDPCTGQFSNPIHFFSKGVNGISFSPDNSKLYTGRRIECLLNSGGWVGKLFQYDLDPWNKDSILASKTVIAQDSAYAFDAMQLGPDGHLYIQEVDTNNWSETQANLGVVRYPNLQGAACDFSIDTIFCGQSTSGMIGLPGFVESYFNGLTSEPNFLTEFEPKKEVLAYPNPAKEMIHLRGLNREQHRIRLLDMRGRTILKKEVMGVKPVLNISSVEAGLYILHGIKDREKAFNLKILIE